MRRPVLWIVTFGCLALFALSGRGTDGKETPAGKTGRVDSDVRVTISKETTYITEPLREDGYPDYLAALNQRASKGVTPENNAVVLLMQAFGPELIDPTKRNREPLPKAVQEKFFRLLGTVPPPEKDRYFADFYKHLREAAPYEVDSDDWPSQSVFQQLGRAERPWSKEDCPLMAGWLAANDKPLERVVEASARPRFYTPIVSEGSLDLFRTSLVAPLRDAARALKARAMLRASQRRVVLARADLQACYRLSRLEAQSPSLFDFLNAVTIEGLACNGDWELAHYTRLTREQAADFRMEINSLAPLPSAIDVVSLGDRFVYLDLVCGTARGSVKLEDLILTPRKGATQTLGGMDSMKLRGLLKEWIGSGQIDWDEALRLGNQHFDRALAAAHKPTWSVRREAVAAVDKELEAETARFSAGLSGKPKDRIGRSTVTRNFSAAYLSIIPNSNSISSLLAVDHRIAIAQQSTPVAFALSAYRTEHGRYPDKLSQLQPSYVAQLPEDPYGEGGFRYRPENSGYVLYSVGPNGADDTGPRPNFAYRSDPPALEKSDDIGIRMPDRSEDEL